jgi:hypothetical protein
MVVWNQFAFLRIRFLSAFIFIICSFSDALAQVVIKGQVKNARFEALAKINVLVYQPNSKLLSTFAISDENGDFEIKINNKLDSLDIELSSIHYRNLSRRVANISQYLQFELIPDVKQLEAFTVKSKPISRKGDTVSYVVRSFAGKEDRAIEDVLKRMPGIEVEPGGRILYQGLPLQKFYVEGLDLMDGRYGVVSKNLPHSSVAAVEILENHQPIRILEDRTASYQASLNLKLQKNITTTGTANLGTGLSPLLWDVNVTPMTFTKDFQLLSSYQSNNTGKDVSRQIKALTLQDLLQSAGRPVEEPELLFVLGASPPEIEQNRFLDNNIHLLNFNGLQKISDDFQLRVNLYYVNDIQKQKSSVKRVLYSPNDTLSFNEIFDNSLHENYLLAEFALNRNVKNNFLNNELKIKSSWDKQNGLISQEGGTINQSLNDPIKSISNEFRSVNPIGKHLVSFQSFISYDNSDHQLSIQPGQFDSLFNQGQQNDGIIQQINLERFFADHSASLVLKWKRLSFEPKLGFAYRQQMLESNILIKENSLLKQADSGFINKLEGRHSNVYFQSEVEYRKKNLTIKTKLPLSWQDVNLSDKTTDQGQQLDRLFFNPQLSISYQFENFWRVSALWRYSNRLEDMERINYGFILRDYRSLRQNSAPLARSSRQHTSLHFSYRNPITAFFSSLSYVYSKEKKNLINSSVINSDGTSILMVFDFPNNSSTHILQGFGSKYISSTKTTLSFRVSYIQNHGKSLVNDALFNTTNIFYFFQPGINIRICQWLNSEYELNASYIQPTIGNEALNTISMLKHKFDLFAFPSKKQMISLNSEYYELQGNNHFFVDLLYRYTFVKRKVDLEIRWKNIFNTTSYTSYQVSSFTVWESTYRLRPSQVFLSLRFSF